MTILYVFPHPDDESFGPAPALAKQRRQGHEVHLLTLTRGEATSQRHKYGYSKREMAEVRYEEMQKMADVLDLSGLTVLDFPDGRLADLDPRSLEAAVEKQLRAVEPQVVVTYAVHGVSGHLDHIVGHAVVKRAFCELRDDASHLRRLAFYALPPEADPDACPSPARLNSEEDIDVVVEPEREDFDRAEAALDCYATYQEVVEENQPLRNAERHGVCFEAFQASPRPRLPALTENLSGS